MSLMHYITNISKAQVRRLIVRAVEDAIILALFCLGIAFVCALCSLLFRWMGVA